MSKQIQGTDFFGGLNVALASHKIDPTELTVSENGWTDEEGVWRVMPGPTTLYTGYSNIKAMAAGRMGGADHVVWLDGSTLYDNGSSVGTLATTSPTIRDFDDKFFILGADDGKNYVYDGSVLREGGAPQAADELYDNGMSPITPGAASSAAVSSITKAANARVTVGSAHPLVVGGCAYITGGDMTQIIGRSYTVTAVDTLWFELDVDSSDFTTYTTGATVHYAACGLSGSYMFHATSFVVVDGRVIEGNPVQLGELDELSGRSWDSSWGAKAYDLSPTYAISFLCNMLSANSWLEYDISGTLNSDWYAGVRLYRTKADGTETYLEKEWRTPDDDLDIQYSIRVPDGELGAVYPATLTQRNNHPRSSVMGRAGLQLFMDDLDNPGSLRWTDVVFGTDYAPFENEIKIPDDITAIGSAGDVAVVYSSDRMWRVSLLGGFPDKDEIRTPVGTTYGNALALTDLGSLFLRDDGLWATDGASPPQPVTRRAFATISGPTGVAAYGDTLAVIGDEAMYVVRRRDGGSYWHGPAVTYTHIDATGGTFYAADANSIYTLFTGARGAGAVETKDFVLGGEAEVTRVVVDVDGDASPVVLVNGNRVSDDLEHPEDGIETGRRLLRFPIPRLLNHVVRVRVEMSGEGGLYGVWLESAR